MELLFFFFLKWQVISNVDYFSTGWHTICLPATVTVGAFEDKRLMCDNLLVRNKERFKRCKKEGQEKKMMG